jgi:hypothetical protein
MSKITYLFGAGASANALPVVNQISDRLKIFIRVLRSDAFKLGSEKIDGVEKTKHDYQMQLIDDLEWLNKETSRHASIDTFAKKLTLKREHKLLRKLKICLSLFFAFEQIDKSLDKRYDSFFASILNSMTKFPENIRILSWNYDAQFELSISEYINQVDLSFSETWLGVRNKFEQKRYDPGFGIFKLNGSASCFVKEDYGLQKIWLLTKEEDKIDSSVIEKIIIQYALATSQIISPFLSFSWEQNNRILEETISETKDTKTLIVIGYSFPFFNRKIDREIIGNMQNLSTVYFQSPEAKKLIQRFSAVDSIKQIVPKLIPLEDDLDQFFLPPEL